MHDPSIEQEAPKRGVAIKLLGVILIFLGALDSMLSWRGGFALNETYILLIASGVFLYAIGAMRHGGRQERPSSADAARNRPSGRKLT